MRRQYRKQSVMDDLSDIFGFWYSRGTYTWRPLLILAWVRAIVFARKLVNTFVR